MIRRMARYNRKPSSIDAWPIPNDGQLRVFARDELGMTNQEVNDDIQEANDLEIYPRVVLHGSETLSVIVGQVVVRDEDGFWGLTTPEELANQFDEDTGRKLNNPTPL